MTAGSTSTDSRLALLGADGETVLEADNDSGTLAAQSSSIAGATIPAAGTYYLRGRRAGGTTELLPYDLLLDVQSGDPIPEVEPNGQNRQPLEGDRFVSGTKAADDRTCTASSWAPATPCSCRSTSTPSATDSASTARLGFGDQTVLVANDIRRLGRHPVGGVRRHRRHAGRLQRAGRRRGTPPAERHLRAVGHRDPRGRARMPHLQASRPRPARDPRPGAATFPIDVPDPGTIDHVAVRLDVEHTFMADLDATLEAPAGNRAALFDDIGSATIGSSAPAC